MHQSYHTSTNTRTHNQINTNALKPTNALKHTKHPNTQNYHYNRLNVEIWQVLRAELFLSYILPPPRTVNMTLSPLLLANGRQLGSSELVISHCPLCLVKLSTEFCMLRGRILTMRPGLEENFNIWAEAGFLGWVQSLRMGLVSEDVTSLRGWSLPLRQMPTKKKMLLFRLRPTLWI